MVRARQVRGHHTDTYTASYDEARAARSDSTALGDLFYNHTGRTVYKWTHYLPAYDEVLQHFRAGFPLSDGGHRPLRMLELGVFHGGSLQIWRQFFGPDASIWGIDINPECEAVDDPNLEVRIGSQADPAFLTAVVQEMGGVDLVVDDGSHIARHQRASFETLFPLLSDGGVYVVEDTHTSYWWDYGGSYRLRRSFLGLTKQLIDDMHAWYHGHGSNNPVRADLSISKITIYDSIVAIHKLARSRPMVVRFGRDSF